MKTPLLKHVLLLIVWLFSVQIVVAQSKPFYHKVRKKETLYSISRLYGITVEDLVLANPGMEQPDYKLKKGSQIEIPLHPASQQQPKAEPQAVQEVKPKAYSRPDDVRTRAIKLGVMLPLHDRNGDGKRMVEYYRGVLMACDSLKKTGISVDVRAWNVPEDSNIEWTLKDPKASECDIIIGPLYSAQMKALSAFVQQHDIMLVVPFSINSPEVYTNKHIFQVYQEPNAQNEATAIRFCNWFKDGHPVIVDCADSISSKGAFTAALRKQLEAHKMKYSLTSLKSSEESFRKAFDTKKQNVVVLNSARSPELNVAIGKLSNVAAVNADIKISLFGYTEWLMYMERQLDNFYQYDAYIPSTFFTNMTSVATEKFRNQYLANFKQNMMITLPRFAITGYDHAFFFLKGLHKYGKTFDGAAGRFGYPPIQTPLKFERIENGGFLNKAYVFIHYKPDQTIDALNY